MLKEDPYEFFVSIYVAQPLSLKWKDRFEIRSLKSQEIMGECEVLNPLSLKTSQSKIKNKIEFLQCLSGSEKEMLLALTQKKGVNGLWEGELVDFSAIPEKVLLLLSQELEAEGKIRILSFSPLFLLSQESIHFLCQKILSHLKRFHGNYPGENGIVIEKLRKRFGLHSRVLSLALKHLSRTRKIKEYDGRIALEDFNIDLSSDEIKLLNEMEKMILNGEFHSVSLEDLRKHFRLSTERLYNMLSLLTEKKRVIQGKEGLILHSRWLDEIVSKIRNSGTKELSVSDFKEMTGLTRKYAIPLLELLDQMGVTKRKGAVRQILD